MADTAESTGRRSLRFNSIDDALAEIERIVAADKTGTLRQVGNWTAGQVLGHLAAWINYGYEGFPMKPPPWFIRLILRWKVKQYLRDGMPTGVRIPGVEGGTFATERIATDEGASRLRQAFARLKRGESPRFDSPAFGAMSMEDRIALNLRHTELHMSFLQV